ncbi:unnamed protein product, partial [Medioppia subpectinata]
ILEFIKGIGVSVFRNYKKHFAVEIIKVSKVYGPVFTLWIGPIPFIWHGNRLTRLILPDALFPN